MATINRYSEFDYQRQGVPVDHVALNAFTPMANNDAAKQNALLAERSAKQVSQTTPSQSISARMPVVAKPSDAVTAIEAPEIADRRERYADQQLKEHKSGLGLSISGFKVVREADLKQQYSDKFDRDLHSAKTTLPSKIEGVLSEYPATSAELKRKLNDVGVDFKVDKTKKTKTIEFYEIGKEHAHIDGASMGKNLSLPAISSKLQTGERLRDHNLAQEQLPKRIEAALNNKPVSASAFRAELKKQGVELTVNRDKTLEYALTSKPQAKIEGSKLDAAFGYKKTSDSINENAAQNDKSLGMTSQREKAPQAVDQIEVKTTELGESQTEDKSAEASRQAERAAARARQAELDRAAAAGIQR